MSIVPFVKYFIEESNKNRALAELYDADINKACLELHENPVDIRPRIINTDQRTSLPQQHQVLYVYPSKEDAENYLLKAEQLIQSIHNISNQVVFEIRGNKKGIVCCFYGEKLDLISIDSGLRNFYPKTITELGEAKPITGNFWGYDFLPKEVFYKNLTTFRDFIMSPINIVAQIFLNIDEGCIGAYQVLFAPLPGEYHEFVKEAVDCNWRALQGTDNKLPPSLQSTGKELEYKSPDFKSYYAVCFRLILPSNSLEASVKAFISNYTYGGKSFNILDNQHYSHNQTEMMLNNRVSYHSGFLVNSHELTSILHIPYQITEDKAFTEIFATAPVGDKPVKTTKYKDIAIGKWACGNSSKEIHLPIQKEIPHAHVLGVSRSGKSILLGHMAIEKFKKGETVFLLDPHGDLVDNILKMVPRNLMHKVVVIDFGLNDLTPQITIRGNVDITNPSKTSDDLTEAMRDVAGSRDTWFGPRMSYAFMCLYYIYSVIPEFNLTHIRQIVSRSPKAKSLRSKAKARINHPIVRDFLEELSYTSQETLMPVITRLSHLLLDERSLRLFTLETNKISINDIMENGRLCLINLSVGIIGKQRSSILAGLMDSLISNNALARASIPYDMRKPCTIIKDEFYLGPGDLDAQLTQLAKYNLSVIFAHQYLDQVEGKTKDVMATAGSRIIFKLRRQDAEAMGRDFGIDPEEFTSLRQFQAIVKIEDEVVKINTPKPVFNQQDYSQEIIQNCFNRYYLRHKSNKNTKEKELSFDTL